MPKALAILISLVALAVVLPDCGGDTNTTTTPAPSASYTPNPSITMATVEVTVNSTPKPYITVDISTPESSASPRPGTPFASQETGKQGMTKFTHLNPNDWYCWVAHLPNSVISSTCANWTTWQYDTIQLGPVTN
jgi:hypothetical protein